jgi:xyloglucan-specific endo-beta-1,4-glucanase
MSDSNLQDFNLDVSPLLSALVKNNLVPANAYIGRVDFGTEAYHTPSNVTFSAAGYSMDLTCGSGSCQKSLASARLVPGLSVLLMFGGAVVLFLQ